MGFLRPKSRGNTDDAETKKRNRLSKPMTNKSQTNLKATAKQQLGEQEEVKSHSQLALDEIVNNPDREDSRAKARSHLFDVEHDGQILSPTNTQSVKSGVAKLVAQYDTSYPAASSSQLSANSHGKGVPEPIVTRLSQLSLSKNSRPSYTSDALDYRSPVQSPTTTTQNSTSQRETEVYRVPTRRRSNFLPGEATRKSSSPGKSSDTTKEDLQNKAQDDTKSLVEEAEKSGYWTPPTSFQLQRSETPHSTFEHKALGNLSLGSLHVVNGRASPAFTEVSLRPKGFPIPSKARDISSEYGDSEAWEDDAVAEDESDADSVGRQTPTNDLYRNFSFTEGAEKHLTPDVAPTTAVKPHQEQPTTPARRPPSTASILAEEYMAELPTSPYSAEGPNSSPPGSTGSVVHHRLEDGIEDFRSFNDGPTHCSPQSKSRKVSNESHGSSVDSKPSEAASKLSSVDSRFAQDEVFQSALEFQQQEPMPSKPAFLRPAYRSNPTNQSDSGYSSNTSVWSLQSREQPLQNQPAFNRTTEVPKKNLNPRKLGGFLPSRPAIKRADTESTIPVSTPPSSQVLVESRPYESSPAPENLAKTISSSPATPTKQRNKLQKARPFSAIISRKAPPPPDEVVVQRNTSVESYSVPVVSPDVTASLRERAQQLPELEHTVENHAKKSDSSLTLAVPGDIRFPTPNPEPVDNERKPRARSRSKSRARSKSRRRSMLEFFTGNKEDKRKSTTSQVDPEVNIDDLGDVVAALGSNPYDIAHSKQHVSVRPYSRPVSRDGRRWADNMEMYVARQIVPHKVSYQHSGPRLMMDAQTASQYARTRSRSIHERDNWDERPLSPVPPTNLDFPFRRTSFNDRGGVPGKNLRSNSFSADAPPMPTMPSPADIRRMSAKYDERNSGHLHRAHHAKETELNPKTSPEAEDGPPPPPPPHSPRPSFMDEDEFAIDDGEDLTIAPPPPSHSPRPMDVHPDSDWMAEDAWAAQARAWKDRRRSAGEALRARYESQGYSYFDPYQRDEENHNIDNPYERVPPRQSRAQYYDGSENWPPQLQRSHTWDGEYGNDNYHYPDYSHHREHFDYDDQDPNEYNYEYTTSPRGRKVNDYQDHNYTPRRAFEHYSHNNNDYYTTPEDETRYDVSYNRAASPVPSARSESRPLPSRPTSRVSYRSNVSGISLAEELHPELMHDKRPSPAPEFGRYSGGLQYSYEGREKGFGGSSGTRSVSGKADAHWKGAELKQGWGVDLGDVPIMGVVRPVQ